MSHYLDSLLDAERLEDCAKQEQQAVQRHARREIARAREAVRRLTRPRRIPGISHELGYWAEVNRCEACIRDAIRAVRFARGNSAIQTFGTAMRDHIIAADVNKGPRLAARNDAHALALQVQLQGHIGALS